MLCNKDGSWCCMSITLALKPYSYVMMLGVWCVLTSVDVITSHKPQPEPMVTCWLIHYSLIKLCFAAMDDPAAFEKYFYYYYSS